MSKQTEIKFKKVITNEYSIDLLTEIFIPFATILIGILFGLSVHYGWIVVSYLCIIGLFLSALFTVIGLIVYLEGRKVYWVKLNKKEKLK